MYTVIYMDPQGPRVLGRFGDKGDCRRAWRTVTTGAAIVGPDGDVLEFRGGTGKVAEGKLKTYAEHLRRQSGTGGAAAPAEEPSRAKVKVARVEFEGEEEEDEPEEDAEADDEEDDTTYTRVERIEQVEAMVARDDARAARRESDASTQPPAPVEPRLAEVTHAHHPVTGAVVVGDDTERITPAAPTTCGAKGCTEAPGATRSNTNPLLADFCPRDRKTAHDRSRASSLTLAQVAAHLRAGTLPPPDPTRVASGRKGGLGMKRAAAKRAAKAVVRRDPKPAKPARSPSPARTLAAGLERVKRHAALVDALGGVEAAEQLAAVVRDAGGVNVVVEALTELRSVA